MSKTVAISLTIITIFFASSCLDKVNDNPTNRNPEKEMRELNEALSSLILEG